MLTFCLLSYELDFFRSDCLSVSKETFDSCLMLEALAALFARDAGFGSDRSLDATLRSLLPAARVTIFYAVDES